MTRRRARVEAPFEHVPLDLQRAGHDALPGALGLRPDVHEHGAGCHGRAGFLRAQPP
jgi:hypothetical protein